MSSGASPAPATPPPLPPRADRRRKPAHSPTPIPNAPSPKNLTSPIVQAAQDVEHARRLLDTPTVDDNLEEAEKEIHKMVREKEVIQLLMRMTDWVEELSSLLQRSFKKESELEIALAMAQSNLQLMHANNDLEESTKRLVTNGSTLKEFGWRPWSKRDSRRTSDEEILNHSVEDTLTPLPKPQSPRNSGASFAGGAAPSPTAAPSTPSRFFNFSSLTRNPSSSAVSIPPLLEPGQPPKPTQREKELAQQLDQERETLKKVTSEKAALESELETLSQALFEQANKMVSNSNRKLAEIEEELRIAMEEREALKSTLRVIASHSKPSDIIPDRVSIDVSSYSHNLFTNDPSTPRAHSRSSSATSSLIFELSPLTPHPNRVAHNHNLEDKDVEDDGERSQVQSHPPNDDPSTEEERSHLETASSNKEPEGSVYSQSESNSTPAPPLTVEETDAKTPVDVEAKEITEAHTADTKQTFEQTLEQVPAQTPPVLPSSNAGPASNPVLDTAPGSSVLEYTLDSNDQNV